MAKKFGKFLAFTAFAAVAGAGAMALYKKFKSQNDDYDFDDFDDDDFDDDFEDPDMDVDRGYTAIPLETEAVDEALSSDKDKKDEPSVTTKEVVETEAAPSSKK
jgi:hypothetical protein